jgi:hypothetical protein
MRNGIDPEFKTGESPEHHRTSTTRDSHSVLKYFAEELRPLMMPNALERRPSFCDDHRTIPYYASGEPAPTFRVAAPPRGHEAAMMPAPIAPLSPGSPRYTSDGLFVSLRANENSQEVKEHRQDCDR